MYVQEKTPAIEAGLAHLRKAIALNYGGVKMEAGWQSDISQYVKLVSDAMDQTQFLSEITHHFVTDVAGPLRKFKLTGSSEQRLETRVPQNLTDYSGRSYDLAVIDNDWTLPYADLDSYTKVGKPAVFIANVNRDMAIKIREDELFVAFNGTSRAIWASDPAMLDIDRSWIQRIRDDNPTNVISEIRAGAGIIVVGPTRWVILGGAAVDKGGGKVGLPSLAHEIPVGGLFYIRGTNNYDGAYTVAPETTENEIVITAAFVIETLDAKGGCVGDFSNLDELSIELTQSIPKNKRQNLKAIMSDTLAGEEKAKLFAGIGGTPTEKILTEQALGTVGSLAKRTPFGFPDNSLMISNPANLEIYLHQVWRRKMEDSEKDRGLNTWSERKRDFIVSDYERVMFAENIHMLKANPGVDAN